MMKPDRFAWKTIYALTGVLALVLGLVIGAGQGWNQAISLWVGSLFLGGMLISWQISAKWIMTEDPPSWTPMLIILRYGLIGGLFYAIIHARLIRWDWFVCGSVLVILAVAITAVIESKRI